jgi:predicted amidophosphoribosyltransferase
MTPFTAPNAGPAGLKCPVCGANFRSAETCPRCGTDLHQLMRLAARAWALRETARARLRAGDLAGALRHAQSAAEVHRL